MKSILFLFLFITCEPLYSQKTDLSDVPKKTSKIILITEQGKEENFKHVIELLLDNDYTIAEKDGEYGTIKSDPRPIEGLNGSYFLTIRAKDDKIIVTGKFIVNVTVDFGGVESNPEFSDIANIGMKGSASKKSFANMYEFALLLKSLNIEYEN